MWYLGWTKREESGDVAVVFDGAESASQFGPLLEALLIQLGKCLAPADTGDCGARLSNLFNTNTTSTHP